MLMNFNVDLVLRNLLLRNLLLGTKLLVKPYTYMNASEGIGTGVLIPDMVEADLQLWIFLFDLKPRGQPNEEIFFRSIQKYGYPSAGCIAYFHIYPDISELCLVAPGFKLKGPLRLYLSSEYPQSTNQTP